MSVHHFVREAIIPRPLHEVFAFFSDARNLAKLTPPSFRFEILTPSPIEMQTGTIIQYSLRVHGLPVHWTTAITNWKPPFEFVDVQLRGPYLLWHHRHRFEAFGDSTRMIDEVSYQLPWGWLGRVVQALLVRRDLESVFEFREQAIQRLMPAVNSETNR